MKTSSFVIGKLYTLAWPGADRTLAPPSNPPDHDYSARHEPRACIVHGEPWMFLGFVETGTPVCCLHVCSSHGMGWIYVYDLSSLGPWTGKVCRE